MRSSGVAGRQETTSAPADRQAATTRASSRSPSIGDPRRRDVPVRQRDDGDEPRAGTDERDESARHRVVAADDATEQRTPWQRDRDEVRPADELPGWVLGGGEGEGDVRNPAVACGAGGTPGCVGHRLGVGVEAEDEGIRAAAGGLDSGPTVTGADVDVEPSIRLDRSDDLADVHLDETTPDDELHGSTVYGSRCGVTAAADGIDRRRHPLLWQG